MFEYLKYLPLLQVAAKHPELVGLFNRLLAEVPGVTTTVNKIASMVQPSIPEIQQAIAEVEAILQNIYSARKVTGEIPDVEFYKEKPKPRRGGGKRRGARS